LSILSSEGEKSFSYEKRIFISYASEDKDLAYRLYNALETFKRSLYDSDSLDIFLDKESLEVGDRWKNVIDKAIRKSHYFILLLSQNSIKKSKYVQQELKSALKKAHRKRSEKYLIPIRLDNCEIPEEIHEYHIIDLYPSNWDKGVDDILKATKLKQTKFPEDLWENLLSDISLGKCIPFIGEAVFEFLNQIDDEKFKTNQEIAEIWAEQYHYPLGRPYELPKVAQFVAIDVADEVTPKQTIARILSTMESPNFSTPPYNMSPHALLAELDFPIYITTNYDHFMEKALENKDKEPVSESCLWKEDLVKPRRKGLLTSFQKVSEKDKYPSSRKPLVFHFHGSYKEPSTMVLTERDYFDFVIYTNQPDFEKSGLSPSLRNVLPNSSLLFIGYNLDGLNFRSLFQGGLSFMSTISKDRNSIAVMQFPSIENKTTEEENVVKYFTKYTKNMFKIIVYWGEPFEFINELLRRWKQFKSKA
jgi:hypothetical protein